MSDIEQTLSIIKPDAVERNLDNQIKFLKTHNACVAYKNRWFTDETNTIGYLYIVRDPRAVACSLAAHSEISIEKAVDDLINKYMREE